MTWKGRCSISLNVAIFERFQTACRERGLAMSSVVTKWIDELDKNGAAFVARTPSKFTLPERMSVAMCRSATAVTARAAVRMEALAQPKLRVASRQYIELSRGLYDMIFDRVVRMRELEGIEATPDDLLDRCINQVLDIGGAP